MIRNVCTICFLEEISDYWKMVDSRNDKPKPFAIILPPSELGKHSKLKPPENCGKSPKGGCQQQKSKSPQYRLFWDEGRESGFSYFFPNQMAEIWPWFSWWMGDILMTYRQNLVNTWVIYDWNSPNVTVR